ARLWTTTTYDALGRPTQVTSPEPGGVSATVKTAYSGSTTITTDARDNLSKQVRNGQGEIIETIGANGLHAFYSYYADGSLYYVSRDAGRGAILNSFTYDSMGRKTQQNDPD
ncbi:hypothetical protein, partial [Luteimonas aquatica]|uniref:hypothetical protein n=1 Tax=Luteimonas aquatica TaxID=450364 RepID=UPI001F5857B5